MLAIQKIEPNKPNIESLNLSAIRAIEQGVWTVISYLSETNPQAAITLAKSMVCSVDSIHEFDWERFEAVYGSRAGLLSHYNQTSFSDDVVKASDSVVSQYLNGRPAVTKQRRFGEESINDEDHNDIHMYAIIAGSSAALAKLHETHAVEAVDISDIVDAPIPNINTTN
jgi:hypothetical protein